MTRLVEVSILTSTFNRPEWLAETIESVLLQVGVEWEMLILDNGSKPGSYQKIIQRYWADSRFRFYRCEENGCFHKLLPELANGEFLTFLPDDDLLIGEDSLSRRVKFLREHRTHGLVFSSVMGHDAEGTSLGQLSMGNVSDFDLPSDAAPFDRLFINDFVPMPSVMWRKKDAALYKEVEWAGPSMDWALWTELAFRYDQGYLAEPCVSLRQHAGQDTHKQAVGFMNAHIDLWQRWAQRGYSPDSATWNACLDLGRELIEAADAWLKTQPNYEYQAVRIPIEAAMNTLPAIYAYTVLPAPEVYLAVIVKNDVQSNEAHCITECLESCKGLISGVFAVFTSEDPDAQGRCDYIVDEWCQSHDMPCEFEYMLWQNDFAQARNTLLALVSSRNLFPSTRPAYLYLPDCDEQLRARPYEITKHLGALSTRACVIPLLMPDGSVGQRVNLLRWSAGWGYVGVRHETLQLYGMEPSAQFIGNPDNITAGPHTITKHDGARSIGTNKLQSDIAAMRAIENKTWRDRFFLAENLFRSAKPEDLEEAGAEMSIAACEMRELAHTKRFQRYGLGFLYCAFLLLGRLALKKGAADSALNYFSSAYALQPTRVEALGEIAEYYCTQQNWGMMRIYALACAHAPVPASAEFLETGWARYRGLELLIVAQVNLGQMHTALQYMELLSKRDEVPAEVTARAKEQLAILKGSG